MHGRARWVSLAVASLIALGGCTSLVRPTREQACVYKAVAAWVLDQPGVDFQRLPRVTDFCGDRGPSLGAGSGGPPTVTVSLPVAARVTDGVIPEPIPRNNPTVLLKCASWDGRRTYVNSWSRTPHRTYQDATSAAVAVARVASVGEIFLLVGRGICPGVAPYEVDAAVVQLVGGP